MTPTAGPIPTLRQALRETPATIPCLAAIAFFVAWASDQDGYPLTHWAPGALVLIALLAIAALGRLPRLAELPLGTRVALAALSLYTALSFLSIAWAHAQADAWEGANRTLLYLVVFALFALWPRMGGSALLLLVVWTLAMVGLAAFVLLHVDGSSHLGSLFSEGRLRYPGDYENASAATWAMFAWPALLLAAGRPLHWALRGVLAGGAVLLYGVALLSLSRGSLYSTPVIVVLIFALLPGRLRTFATIVPVAAGIGLCARPLLRVGDRLLHGGDAKAAMHTATSDLLLAALLVALLVGAAAAFEGRARLTAQAQGRVRVGMTATALAALVAVLAGGWVAAGNPVHRVEEGWNSFKGGYANDRASGSRLTSGLGSERYDFYRVALDEFLAHPLAGIGADNFQQQYLQHGRSLETPHYPHSVELRTLAQTGVIGAILAILGLVGALLASARALSARARRADPGATVAASAALAGFAYWVAHGSFDWFWEFAGLGAPAFALLGIACAAGAGVRVGARPARSAGRATSRRTDAQDADPDAEEADSATPGAKAGVDDDAAPSRTRFGGRSRPTVGGRAPALAIALVLALLVLASAASLAAPWLGQLQIQRAASIWPTAPRKAYADLGHAADLNPLSDEAQLLAGSIALRFGDLLRAQHEFELALERNPRDVYANLELGAIASALGRREQALARLRQASRLSPRDELIRETLSYVRSGHKVNIEELNREILLKARRLA